MDALTFATPRLIRNLMAAVAQKLPINVYEHDKANLFLLAHILQARFGPIFLADKEKNSILLP